MSALVIAPHMDDEVLGCAGLLQRLPQSTVAFCTRSLSDRRLNGDGLYVAYSGLDRHREVLQVAGLLDYRPRWFAHEVHALDSVPLVDLVRELEGLLDGVELVAYPGPSNDEDHNAVRRAVRALSRPHLFSGTLLEYLPWGSLDLFADTLHLGLSEDEMAKKFKAMALYRTQVAPGGLRDPLYPYSPESVKAYAEATGRLIHAGFSEPYVPKRVVANHTTGRLLGG